MLGENITFNQVGKFTVPLQLKPFLMSVMPATSQIFVPFRPFQKPSLSVESTEHAAGRCYRQAQSF